MPKPLSHRRILVTRSREQAGALSARLQEAGATPVEVPLIRIEDPEDWTPLDRAIERLGAYDWVVFTSGNAVEKFLGRLVGRGYSTQALSGLRIAAVGPATAGKLRAHGVSVVYQPERFDADALVEGLARSYEMKNARVLFPAADIGRETVVAGLSRLGARVTKVTAYRTVSETALPPEITTLLERNAIHAVTFASPSTVRAFAQAVGATRLRAFLDGVSVACMGPVTRRAAEEAGMTVDIVPDRATVSALVEAIINAIGRK